MIGWQKTCQGRSSFFFAPSWGDPTSRWYWDLAWTNLWPALQCSKFYPTISTQKPSQHQAQRLGDDWLCSLLSALLACARLATKSLAPSSRLFWKDACVGIEWQLIIFEVRDWACTCGADKEARIRPSIATMTFEDDWSKWAIWQFQGASCGTTCKLKQPTDIYIQWSTVCLEGHGRHRSMIHDANGIIFQAAQKKLFLPNLASPLWRSCPGLEIRRWFNGLCVEKRWKKDQHLALPQPSPREGQTHYALQKWSGNQLATLLTPEKNSHSDANEDANKVIMPTASNCKCSPWHLTTFSCPQMRGGRHPQSAALVWMHFEDSLNGSKLVGS